MDDEPSIFEKNKIQEAKIEETSFQLKPQTDLRHKNHDTLLYKDVHRLQPEKQSVSKTLDKKITENTTIGATYITTEKEGELDDSATVFTKYE